jgi:hypothetical protein
MSTDRQLEAMVWDELYRKQIVEVLRAARKLRQAYLDGDKSAEFYAAEEVVLAIERLDA